MNIAVAPVSAIACDVTPVIALRVLKVDSPHLWRAVAAVGATFRFEFVVLDVTMVASSSSTIFTTLIKWVGIGETIDARFNLSATCILSAPTCQKPAGGN